MKKDFSGNIGNWSEIYVLFKLLAEGKLFAADINLQKIPDLFFPIIKILRQELAGIKREYVLNGKIKIVDGTTNKVLKELPVSEFLKYSKILFSKLKILKGRSFNIPEIHSFLRSIDVNVLNESKTEKQDIKIVVHDLRTGFKPSLGFSIKSLLGKNSTLFNPAASTNFIYNIFGASSKNFNSDKFNKSSFFNAEKTRQSKISYRLKEIEKLGFTSRFQNIESDILEMNLKLIDSELPQILAQMLIYKYRDGISKTTKILNHIYSENPMNYNLVNGHPFYEYKIKNFLTDSALGMTADKVWIGKYSATGGLIIVKSDGEVVCYHIYNRDEFQQYLLNNTKFEQAATGEDEDNPGYPSLKKNAKRYRYGWVYEENKRFFIKLNLQVRFTN